MKRFEIYQYVGVRKRTRRDARESKSKFWNEGKWNNFILPFINEKPDEMTFIDNGCGAGLFLRLAKDLNFKKAIGVELNEGAYEIAQEYRKRNKRDYEVINGSFPEVIDKLPVSDYTILSNVHYYITVGEWIDYLDNLKYKTRKCILVTGGHGNSHPCSRPQTDLKSIRRYFADWTEEGTITKSQKDDPAPRVLKSICFKSKLKRVKIDKLIKTASGGEDFYEELDRGVPYNKTQYFERINKSKYPKRWSVSSRAAFVKRKMFLYEEIKNGMLKPPLIKNNLILDGNHRIEILKNLGYKSVIIREV